MANGKSLLEILENEERVRIIDGKVQTCAKFGDKVQHAEVVEAKDFKGLRSDVFVLCSSYYMLSQLTEIYVHLPILRAGTELVLRTNGDCTNKLLLLNGPSSVKTPDNLPLVGSCAKLSNLYFLTGFSSVSLPLRVQASKQLVNLIIDGERSSITESFSPRRFQKYQ